MENFSIHGWLGRTMMYYFFFLAIWGYFRFFRKQGIDSSFWGALMLGEVVLILQALIGAWLYFGAGVPLNRPIHMLYGILTPALVPAIYAYTKGRDGRPESLAYATALLITAALAFRALSIACDHFSLVIEYTTRSKSCKFDKLCEI